MKSGLTYIIPMGKFTANLALFLYRTESKEDSREGIRDSKEYIEVGKQVQDPR